MGKRGPKKTDKKILAIHGSWRADKPDEKTAPEPPAELPAMPKYFDRNGKDYWKEITVELMKRGTLTKADRSALIALCQTWSDFLAAKKAVDDFGSFFETEKGFIGKHPAVAQKQKALDQYMKLAAKFGLTPADRDNVKPPDKKEPVKGKERFFKQGG